MINGKVIKFQFNGRLHYVYRNESGHLILDDDDINYHPRALRIAAVKALEQN